MTFEEQAAVLDRKGVVALRKVTKLETVLPLLTQFPDLEELSIGNPASASWERQSATRRSMP